MSGFKIEDYNKKVNHPLQAFEWGDFRRKTGVKVVRGENYQLTLHKIPHSPFFIGYLPKSEMPDKKTIQELREIGKAESCIFIQIEPNVVKNDTSTKNLLDIGLIPSAHPLFTNYTFILDITKSEEELLSKMHSKTRYNIRVALKHKVTVKEESTNNAFKEYLKLTRETTKRQKFFAHSESYHKLMWETLSENKSPNGLSAHLLIARHKGKVLVAWIVFVFKDTLYYPYGASSSEARDTMASNLMMWEAIKFGKKLGLKKFDMWGAMGPNPDPKDPWYGFHRFKQGYSGTLTEFVGSWDLVLNKPLYSIYKIADKIRWTILRFK